MVTRHAIPVLPVLPLLALLAACQAEDPCADGSMLASEEGLVVTDGEHVDGWGQADCWQCHVAAEIHRTGCTPDVDIDALVDQVEAQGLASCAGCHGDNGVSP